MSWERLDKLVPDDLDPYWQQTLKISAVRARDLAAYLQSAAIEPAARRDCLIKAEAARLARKTDAPVIAAGSTGSIPATAELIATIAQLPHGAVVLPGLDTDLDEDSWRLIGGNATPIPCRAPGHAQFAMQALLARIGIAPRCGRAAGPHAAWPRAPGVRGAASGGSDRTLASRARRKISRPNRAALASDHHDRSGQCRGRGAGDRGRVARSRRTGQDRRAGNARPRAWAPRRGGAERWNIAVDDSGGDALSDTPAGIFARLAAEAALDGLAPVTLLALLKHPLLRLGAGDNTRAIAALERALLRGPRPRPGSAGLADALYDFRARARQIPGQAGVDLHRSDPRRALFDDDLEAAAELVAQLAAALAPLEEHRRRASAARRSCRASSRRAGGPVARRRDRARFVGPTARSLREALRRLGDSEAAGGLAVAPSDYVELFPAALADRVVRPPPLPTRACASSGFSKRA